jgi:Kef-type K+ transport system membrane component KefB
MEILYILLVLLVSARACGEFAIRLGQPALVGEIVAGIAIGMLIRKAPHLFPVMADINSNHVFTAFTDLGIFFLMLSAGLEMQPEDLAEASASSAAIAAGGMLLPLGAGGVLGWAFLPDSEFKIAQTLFIGVAIAVTAVPVAVKVLMDFKKLDTRLGAVVVSAAVMDDIMSLVLLALLTALIRSGSLPGGMELLLIAGRILLFFALVLISGKFLLSRIAALFRMSASEEIEFSILVAAGLGFAVAAEWLSLHFLLGAFAAGLLFTRRTASAELFESVQHRVSGISTGFLAPIFFASIGLNLDVSAVGSIPLFLSLLLLAALIGKLGGAGLPAYLTGRTWRDSLAIGLCMNARGAVGLIVADIALRQGLFDHPQPVPPVVANLFSAVVLMAVATTLATPLGLRRVLRE